jgi:hypothetical protein
MARSHNLVRRQQQQQLFATRQVQMQQWMALQQQMMVEHMQASMLAVQNCQPMPPVPVLPTPGAAPETPVVSNLTSLFFHFNNYRLRERRDLDSLRNLEKVETY